MAEFLQQIINSLGVGSIYALIALGYTMVYGIVKLINFAHGDILMMGAYFGVLCLTAGNLPLGLAIIISMVLCALFGMIIDKLAYKPLRNAPRISALITALGVSMFLENIFRVIFGAEVRKVPEIGFLKGYALQFGSIQLSRVTLATLLLAVLSMVVLQFIVKKTKMGKAMRAVSEDQGAARLMGINVNKTISITFALGSSLGALGGVLFSIAYTQVEPYMGIMPGLKAFVAAVFGGIGIIPGAMFGGFAMGLFETLTKGYISKLTGGFISTNWSNAIVFGILIIVLLVKPAGIFGKNVREKV